MVAVLCMVGGAFMICAVVLLIYSAERSSHTGINYLWKTIPAAGFCIALGAACIITALLPGQPRI